MNINDMHEAANNLQIEIQAAQKSLDDARVKFRDTGARIGADEYASLKREVREKTSELHSLYRAIKDAKRGKSRSGDRNAAFVKATTQLASKELLEKIRNLSDRILKNESETVEG